MSAIEISALAMYAVIFAASIVAAKTAALAYNHSRDVQHWAAIATIFAVIAGSRMVGIEDRLGAAFRSVLQAAGDWEQRQMLQVPLTIAIALIGLALLLRFFLHWRQIRRGSPARLVLLSRYALLGLFILIGFRLVSLHQIDMVLYSSPVRINWLIEGVICLAVAGSAIFYARAKTPQT